MEEYLKEINNKLSHKFNIVIKAKGIPNENGELKMKLPEKLSAYPNFNPKCDYKVKLKSFSASAYFPNIRKGKIICFIILFQIQQQKKKLNL